MYNAVSVNLSNIVLLTLGEGETGLVGVLGADLAGALFGVIGIVEESRFLGVEAAEAEGVTLFSVNQGTGFFGFNI